MRKLCEKVKLRELNNEQKNELVEIANKQVRNILNIDWKEYARENNINANNYWIKSEF